MVRPSHVSWLLRRAASNIDSGRYRGASETSVALRSILAGMSDVKVKLKKTTPSEEEGADETQFEQTWVITLSDGSKVETVTDAGWGDEVGDVEHGSVPVDVCGHQLSISELLGIIISTGFGPTTDGEETVLDGEWCSMASKEGYLS